MRFLSKKQVSQKIGLSRTEIDRKEAVGKFPKRIQVGFRVFWVEEEVENWMQRLIDNRDHAAPDRHREKTTEPPHQLAAD